MSAVIADACPLIFLAKLDRLALVRGVFPGIVRIPEAVRGELEVESIPLPEQRRLGAFLQECRTERVPRPRYPSQSLSHADRCVLTLAAKHQNAILLSDDALLRRVAIGEGLAVAGTLGLLIRATRAGFLSNADAREAVDTLVARHQFRIAVALYQETLRQLG